MGLAAPQQPHHTHTPHGIQSLRKQIFNRQRQAKKGRLGPGLERSLTRPPAAYYARGSAGAKEAFDAGPNELFTAANPPRFIPIVMIAAFRPHYMRRVLAALEACDGIHDTVLVVSQDGSDPEVSVVSRHVLGDGQGVDPRGPTVAADIGETTILYQCQLATVPPANRA